MNFVLHGTAVSAGITIGHAHLVSSARLEAAHYEIPETAVQGEIFRFDAAIARAKQELAALEGQIPADAPGEFATFINLHRMILPTPRCRRAARADPRARMNAEGALVRRWRAVAQFEKWRTLPARARQTSSRCGAVLKPSLAAGRTEPTPASAEGNLIVVAHDLSPADMILFKRHKFGGFVTDVGGVTSHTAIVARSLNIPALVGLHHARQMIRENDVLIVDGIQGVLVVDPDALVLGEYRLRQSQHGLDGEAQALKSTPSATLWHAVELFAKTSFPGSGRLEASGAQGGPVPHLFLS